jgi:hypothetical protein
MEIEKVNCVGLINSNHEASKATSMRVTPFFLAIGLATALENGLARTPQLGWVRIG